MIINVCRDGGDERWWFDKPGEPYAEPQGNIEIPAEVVGEFFAIEEAWIAENTRLRAWLEAHIEANGGEHFEDFLRGEITEEHMRARVAGCEHKRTKLEDGVLIQRLVCTDCGRSEFNGIWL